MPVYVRQGGIWNLVAMPGVRVGGVWRGASAWVKVGGVWKNVSLAEPHVTTITVGSIGDGGSPYETFTYGFSDGVAAGITIGAIGDATFTDSSGAVRTIHYMAETGSPGVPQTLILGGQNVANDNLTFQRIVVNGVTFVRTDATYDGGTGGYPYSTWTWSGAAFPVSGVVDFKVFFDASQS